jgi:hypothetical protein
MFISRKDLDILEEKLTQQFDGKIREINDRLDNLSDLSKPRQTTKKTVK